MSAPPDNASMNPVFRVFRMSDRAAIRYDRRRFECATCFAQRAENVTADWPAMSLGPLPELRDLTVLPFDPVPPQGAAQAAARWYLIGFVPACPSRALHANRL